MSLKSTFNVNDAAVQKAIQRLNSRFWVSVFFWTKLPAAAYFGIKVTYCDHLEARVLQPYSWRSKNPFRSVYFAAQCAAAEISTGLLAQIALIRPEKISMLVVHFEAVFLKKATSDVTFCCTDGAAAIAAVDAAVATREAQTLQMTAIGQLESGEISSKMIVTWSFKIKQ